MPHEFKTAERLFWLFFGFAIGALFIASQLGHDVREVQIREAPTTTSTHPTTTQTAAPTTTQPAPRPTPTRANTTRRSGYVTAQSASTTSTGAHRTGGRVVTSTAYCLQGTMANGQAVHSGAAASNLWPLGTRVRVVGSGAVYIISDRSAPGATGLDIWMSSCDAARAYGRHLVTVEVT